MLFRDREEAGTCLAERLQHLRPDEPVVLGVPRGGVAVARPVAAGLGAPLGVVVARKVGVPFQPELSMGAIGEDGTRIVHDAVVRAGHVTGRELDRARLRERVEVDRRARCYREVAGPASLADRTVVVVDDGVATGATAWVACRVARGRGAARVVLATPVAPKHTITPLREAADEVVCVKTFDALGAVGRWYRDFTHVSDDEVKASVRDVRPGSIAAAACPRAAAVGAEEALRPAASVRGHEDLRPVVRRHEVQVPSDGARVRGLLSVPRDPTAVVAVVQGSGTARHSPRTRYLAEDLQQAGLATLVCDLLAPTEELDRASVFDVGLLTRRLVDVLGWLTTTDLGGLDVGLLGTGTGAAATIAAAGADAGVAGLRVGAIASVSGQPGLARAHVAAVRAPVLLVVGGQSDRGLLGLNRQAVAQMRCPHHLAVVRGAGDLFEEPGALERAALHVRSWFLDHVPPAARLPRLPRLTGTG